MVAAEIMRRRFQLEREMMMLEREMLAVRRPEGFSFLSASEFGPSVSVMNRCESRLTEERLAMSLEEKLGYRNRYWIEEFETVPLHRCAEPRISEIEPSLEQVRKRNLFSCSVLLKHSLTFMRLTVCMIVMLIFGDVLYLTRFFRIS